jgi:hypothetical protein
MVGEMGFYYTGATEKIYWKLGGYILLVPRCLNAALYGTKYLSLELRSSSACT